jgi:ferredoxin
MRLMNFNYSLACGTMRKLMANPNDRNPENVDGRFFVDDSCIDCDQCRNSAADFFAREDSRAYSYVYRQPETDEEIALAREAMEGCPSESIGESQH